MAAEPRVSVIIPTYQSEDTIDVCLDSVFCQTLSDFEVICVDDGSSDSTFSLLEKHARRDHRMELVHQDNEGPGVARNIALAKARGEYVYCLDADDFLEPDMLATCVKVLDKSGAEMALVAFYTYNHLCKRSFFAEWSMRNKELFPSYPAGTFTWRTNADHFFETIQNVPWNKMVRADLLRKSDISFQNLHLTEDVMFSLPAAVKASKIVRIAKPLVHHREYEGTNAMSDKGRHPLDFLEAFMSLRLWLEREGLFGDLRTTYRTWLLDAVYYNLPTYRSYDSFVMAYNRLTTDGLSAFDLAAMDGGEVVDLRHRALLKSLQELSLERFLLACLNIEAEEVQEQRAGFQDCQTSLKWLVTRFRERLIGR